MKHFVINLKFNLRKEVIQLQSIDSDSFVSSLIFIIIIKDVQNLKDFFYFSNLKTKSRNIQ